ncbi:hypothetical protein QR680_013497 [Steinernema hermaphroditum]|uniref:Zinc metalloproteinase n=1 Tax=Steinernema hermaphroditum TaxID=289476 RepID=A0AA39I808_9BILA|nr:hypothetical protein QR680_013497 [Steinernema hermaphroditum]
MKLLLLFSALIGLGHTVTFYEYVGNQTSFHGISVEKYVTAMNRMGEINCELHGLDKSERVKFEEIEYDREGASNENPFLYQGHIILGEKQLDALMSVLESQRASKKGKLLASEGLVIDNTDLLWPDNPIPYAIDSDLQDSGAIPQIQSALKMWEEATCLSFKEDILSDDSIIFFESSVCSTMIGHVLREGQMIDLNADCAKDVGHIAHELGHTLGLLHTEARQDRDKYVKIFWNNIQHRYRIDFEEPTISTSALKGYDFGSLMHSSSTSRLRENLEGTDEKTISPKDERFSQTLGFRKGIAFSDAKQINKAYCGDVCHEELECQRGGYPDPKDCSRCRCPDGFSGKLCDQLTDGSGAQCGPATIRASKETQEISASGEGTCYFLVSTEIDEAINAVMEVDNFKAEKGVCQDNFVEVKFAEDKSVTGARYCNDHLSGASVVQKTDNSKEVLIIYKSTNSESKLKISISTDEVEPATQEPPYSSPVTTTESPPITTESSAPTEEPSSSSSSSTTTSGSSAPTKEPSPSSTTPSQCSCSCGSSTSTSTTSASTTTTTTTSRPSTTEKTHAECDEEYGEWSRCSERCGGCGTRFRQSLADPLRREEEICNLQPCKRSVRCCRGLVVKYNEETKKQECTMQ